MKKFFKYLMLPALAAASLSCTKTEEIVFDHERQAFESRDGKILIEAIMPQASTADEEIYIVGAFNGYVAPAEGEQAPEYKNPEFLMERSAVIPQKWGIYLDPSSFVGGKTLADGFTFISVKQGEERSPLGERVSHTLNIGPGQWANVYVDKWAKYFEKDPGPQPLPTHDGVRIYIVDNTGWEAIALYQWGDENNLGGGWPGAQVAGELDYQGAHYKYFDYEDSIMGLTQNLIFNNNGGGTQLDDYKVTFADGVKDYFFEVTASGVKELGAPVVEDTIPEHEGEVWVSIIDQTGWDVITLYQWGSTNNLGGEWPGAQVAGTFDYKGQTWKYFSYPVDDVVGKGQNLIFSNNGANQLKDYALEFAEGVSDYLLVVTADGVTAYSEDNVPEPDQPDVPVDPKKASVTIYIDNQAGYEALAIYMYGDKELCGGWPGLAPAKTEVISGTTYSVFVVEDAMDRAENIILNNNGGGAQLKDFAVTFSKDTYYFTATADGLTEIEDPHPAGVPSTIYVADNSGWDALGLYAYGDVEAFGGWPGASPSGTVTLSGVTYKTFDVSAELSGKTENLIFNNAGAGAQFDGPKVTLGSNLVFSITNSTCTTVENPTIRVYVINETGWDELHLYTWGDDQQYFGGWPGSVPAGKQTVNGVEYDYFELPAEGFAAGSTLNFIFNNNAGTQYENDPGLKGNKATRDYYFKLTATGAEVIE